MMSNENAKDEIASFCDSGNWDAAISALLRAIDDAPSNANLWARMGWCKFSMGAFQGAIPDLSRALELKPGGATTLYIRARCWEEVGELDKAVLDYSESLRVKPKADAFIARGLIHKYKGRIDQAVSDFEDALRFDPGNEVAEGLLRHL